MHNRTNISSNNPPSPMGLLGGSRLLVESPAELDDFGHFKEQLRSKVREVLPTMLETLGNKPFILNSNWSWSHTETAPFSRGTWTPSRVRSASISVIGSSVPYIISMPYRRHFPEEYFVFIRSLRPANKALLSISHQTMTRSFTSRPCSRTKCCLYSRRAEHSWISVRRLIAGSAAVDRHHH